MILELPRRRDCYVEFSEGKVVLRSNDGAMLRLRYTAGLFDVLRSCASRCLVLSRQLLPRAQAASFTSDKYKDRKKDHQKGNPMELPQTLEALHHHLGLLIGLLQQEQELLLHTPVPAEEDSLRRLRLEQDKQSHFRAIEGLENQCKDLRRTLGSAAPEELPLWKEVRDLTDQALRLHQLNSTLIRQGLVHEQCVLNNVRQLGSTSPTALAGLTTTQVAPAAEAPSAATTSSSPRKSRRRKVADDSRVH